MALPIQSTPTIYGKDARRFLRRMRASDMSKFLKTGCDMGWYGHFVGLVYVDPVKMRETIDKIMQDCLRKCEPQPGKFSKVVDDHFFELS